VTASIADSVVVIGKIMLASISTSAQTDTLRTADAIRCFFRRYNELLKRGFSRDNLISGIGKRLLSSSSDNVWDSLLDSMIRRMEREEGLSYDFCSQKAALMDLERMMQSAPRARRQQAVERLRRVRFPKRRKVKRFQRFRKKNQYCPGEELHLLLNLYRH